MKIRFELHDDRIHIKLDPMYEQIKSIMVPDDHREQTRTAEILAIGPKVKEHGDFKVGDKIIASFHTGIPIELPQYEMDGTIHKICRESEIMTRIFEEE